MNDNTNKPEEHFDNGDASVGRFIISWIIVETAINLILYNSTPQIFIRIICVLMTILNAFLFLGMIGILIKHHKQVI